MECGVWSLESGVWSVKCVMCDMAPSLNQEVHYVEVPPFLLPLPQVDTCEDDQSTKSGSHLEKNMELETRRQP